MPFVSPATAVSFCAIILLTSTRGLSTSTPCFAIVCFASSYMWLLFSSAWDESISVPQGNARLASESRLLHRLR